MYTKKIIREMPFFINILKKKVFKYNLLYQTIGYFFILLKIYKF